MALESYESLKANISNVYSLALHSSDQIVCNFLSGERDWWYSGCQWAG